MYREDGSTMDPLTKENAKEMVKEAVGIPFVSVEDFKEQEMVLAECFALILNAGLLPELSRKTRDYLSESEMINNFIQAGQGPNLEPRMSVDEYRTHLMRALDVPPAQFEFLNFIVKTCYMMIMAEKNPLIAQELRGVTMVSEHLKGVLGR